MLGSLDSLTGMATRPARPEPGFCSTRVLSTSEGDGAMLPGKHLLGLGQAGMGDITTAR